MKNRLLQSLQIMAYIMLALVPFRPNLNLDAAGVQIHLPKAPWYAQGNPRDSNDEYQPHGPTSVHWLHIPKSAKAGPCPGQRGGGIL